MKWICENSFFQRIAKDRFDKKIILLKIRELVKNEFYKGGLRTKRDKTLRLRRGKHLWSIAYFQVISIVILIILWSWWSDECFFLNPN